MNFIEELKQEYKQELEKKERENEILLKKVDYAEFSFKEKREIIEKEKNELE